MSGGRQRKKQHWLVAPPKNKAPPRFLPQAQHQNPVCVHVVVVSGLRVLFVTVVGEMCLALLLYQSNPPF